MIWFFIAAVRVSFVQDPLVTALSVHPRASSTVSGDLTPSWQLIMPNQIMTAHNLAIPLGQVDNRIPLGPTKLILLRLDRSPLNNQPHSLRDTGEDDLLRIPRRDLPEIIRIAELPDIRLIRQFGVVSRRTEVFQTGGFGGCV